MLEVPFITCPRESILLVIETGSEAKKLFNDAESMLEKITKTKSLWPVGVVAFYPANSVGDDIHVFEDDDARKESPRAVFYGLRQQVSEQCQTLASVISSINGTIWISV